MQTSTLIDSKNDFLKSLAKSLFFNGEVYLRAAYLLNAQKNIDPALILPGNVNAALALELYFSSLFILDRKAEFRVGGRPSHRFDILFDQLTSTTRHILNKKFNDIINERPMNDVLIIEKVMEMAVPRTLKKNLENWSRIFVELRYVHAFKKKYENKKLDMVFFPEVRNCVVNVILEIEPTWANPGPKDIEDFVPLYPAEYLARQQLLKSQKLVS